MYYYKNLSQFEELDSSEGKHTTPILKSILASIFMINIGENDMKNEQGVGIGFILFIVFLVLKLTKVVTWSWWLVTAPLWIPFGIALVIMVIATVVALIREIIKNL